MGLNFRCDDVATYDLSKNFSFNIIVYYYFDIILEEEEFYVSDFKELSDSYKLLRRCSR